MPECGEDSERPTLDREGGPSPGADIASPAGPGPAGRTTPARIGRYRIIELLGEGGMGVVYLAEQDHPRRTVALKIIRPGLITVGLLRRFEHEAQILGRLRHPGIAQVYEAGVHQDAHGAIPYIAMEHVSGRPLADHARAGHIDVRQRLELMRRVCEAVQYAHQKGVIHRDLKPANILVDASIDPPQPRVLDFGVARVTDADVHATLETQVGQIVGTLQYMSPEQTSGDPHDLDLRADVYALGVILYELLAGAPPHDLRGKMIHETVRIIREDEPAPLGTVDRTFRGDLSTILGKALEKDRERRYQSAAELSADLGRHLRGEPIAAHPRSTVYQLRKFAHRHRAIVAGALVALVAMVAGTAVALWQAAVATGERDEALRQAAIARAINQFLNEDLLAAANPWLAQPGAPGGRDVKVVDILRSASERMEGRFAGEPVVEASIRKTLGETYQALEMFDEAVPQLEASIVLRRRELGEAHEDTLTAMLSLASVYANLARHDDARALLERTMALLPAALGPAHPKTLKATTYLASLHRWRGDNERAEELYRSALEIQRQTLGEEDDETLTTMGLLAFLYDGMGRLEEAEALAARTLEIRRQRQGEEHPDTMGAMQILAGIYTNQGRHEEAEPLLRRAVELRTATFGARAPATLDCLVALANLYRSRGKSDDARRAYLEVIAGYRETFGPDSLDALVIVNRLGTLYVDGGRIAEAQALLSEALEVARRAHGAEAPVTLVTINNLGRVLLAAERYAEAEQLLAGNLEATRRVFGERHFAVAACRVRYGASLRGLGRWADSETMLLEGHAGTAALPGSNEPALREAAQALVDLYEAWGRPADAARWRAELR